MCATLEIAAWRGHTGVVALLIEAGADINYQNGQVMSLHVFLSSGSLVSTLHTPSGAGPTFFFMCT
jgi:ankyrin repeat protein